MIRRRKMSEKSFPLRCISCNYQGVLSVERGVARRDASRQIFARYADAGAGCSIISTMLAHSWGGIKRAVGCRSGTRGRGRRGEIRRAVVHRSRVERGPINQPQISMHGTFA